MSRCEYTELVELKRFGGELVGAISIRCKAEGTPIPLDDDPSEVMVLCGEHASQANDPVWTKEER